MRCEDCGCSLDYHIRIAETEQNPNQPVPQLRETGSGHRTDVTQAEKRDVHGCPKPRKRRTRSLDSLSEPAAVISTLKLSVSALRPQSVVGGQQHRRLMAPVQRALNTAAAILAHGGSPHRIIQQLQNLSCKIDVIVRSGIQRC